MFIHSINIENYRGFEAEQFNFHGQFTALIGDNGSGKTSILDAIAFALGTFLRGVDGIDNIELKASDKRQVFVAPDSKEIKLPLKINITHDFNQAKYQWNRELAKAGSTRSTYITAKSFINDVENAIAKVRAGKPIDLPLFVLYGVERLSTNKPDKEEARTRIQSRSRLCGINASGT